jgi:hypothetical protein
MATAKSKMYLHAFFDKEGKFQSWSFHSYKMDSNPGEYGMFVCAKEIEVECEVPDLKEVQVKAAESLDEAVRRKVADHQLWMTQAAFLKNNLLQLEHSNILDRDDMQQFGTRGEEH